MWNIDVNTLEKQMHVAGKDNFEFFEDPKSADIMTSAL